MRYAIPATDGKATWLENPVDVPQPLPNWAATPDVFLAKMFPNLNNWVLVADDNVSGAILQQDGTYKNPTVPVAVPPVSTTKQQILNQIAVLQGLANQLP